MSLIRIKEIASLVNDNSFILDVGTDHAYLPIYLIKNKIVMQAYASDISELALKIAQKKVLKSHLENEIKLLNS